MWKAGNIPKTYIIKAYVNKKRHLTEHMNGLQTFTTEWGRNLRNIKKEFNGGQPKVNVSYKCNLEKAI